MSDIQYAATPVSGALLEHVAGELRQIFGVTAAPFFPILEVVEWGLVRAIGDDYSFEVADAADMGQDHGRSYPDEKRLILRSDVYEGLIDHKGRDRFTAAHEMSHLVLHTQRRLSRRIGVGPIKVYCDPEWQANRLAGAVLMPADLVTRFRTVADVVETFGVSADAARVRLRQLKIEVIEK